MAAIIELSELLKNMKPVLDNTDYVFVTTGSHSITNEIMALNPIATFLESEGLTLVISRVSAETHNMSFDTVFHKITLEVHSSLEAVGLTAAISTALAKRGLSANIIAGFYHDHVFIQKNNAELALTILQELTL